VSGAPIGAGEAVAFPGQGVAPEDVAAALAEHGGHPLVGALAAALGETARLDAVDVGDARASMGCTFVAGLVTAQARYGERRPAMVLGHSLGEITALAFAGALTAEDALALVLRRGEIGNHVQARRPGAMAVVMGLDGDAVEWVRRRATAGSAGVVDIAAENGERQYVLSGDRAAVDAAVTLAAADGASVARLPIPGAFHSSLMAGAVADFTAAVDGLSWSAPAVPFLSAFDGSVHDDPGSIRGLVARALVLPVRWRRALRAARAAGVAAVWEAGPGSTLTRLGRRERLLPFVS
jgi:[acyl-carrier-protein] S-malonyltransferase